MGGWLVQVPVKRFGTEALVHLYAVWMPDTRTLWQRSACQIVIG